MINIEPKDKEKNMKKEYLTPSGRYALSEILKLLRLDKNNKILIPSYIGLSKREGSGVYDPINELKVGYEFYNLNEDLSIDKSDFTQKIKKDDIKACLIIHYFGYCQKNFDKIIKICQKYKKHLIEDCAHAFNSCYHNKKLGSLGDFSLYSLHKFLAIDDGGILVINNDKFNLSNNPEEKVKDATKRAFYKSNIDDICKKRIKNFIYMFEKIKNIKGVHPFFGLPENGIVPLNFPIIVEEKDRNKMYFALLERGIETASIYHTLIPQIKKDQYPIPHNISNHILNLPIHQEISEKDIDLMLKELKNLMEAEL